MSCWGLQVKLPKKKNPTSADNTSINNFPIQSYVVLVDKSFSNISRKWLYRKVIIFVHFSAKARQYCFLFFFSAHDSHINKTSWTKIRTRCKAIVAGAWLSWHHTMMPQLLLERCIVREAAIWLLSAADSCSRATDPTLETQEDRWTLSTGKPHTRAHTHRHNGDTSYSTAEAEELQCPHHSCRTVFTT